MITATLPSRRMAELRCDLRRRSRFIGRSASIASVSSASAKVGLCCLVMRTPTNRFPGQGNPPRDASDRQFDIFKVKERPAEQGHPSSQPRQVVACEKLDDSTLVAALTRAGIRDCVALAAEAGRRRLVAAIPA